MVELAGSAHGENPAGESGKKCHRAPEGEWVLRAGGGVQGELGVLPVPMHGLTALVTAATAAKQDLCSQLLAETAVV